MKLDPTTKYEIKAEAFYIMTGLMAPGKDAPAEFGDTWNERNAAWEKFWTVERYEFAEAMLNAMKLAMPDDD